MTASADPHGYSANPIGHKVRTGPLSGLIVADFGRVLAAPYCTMLLADLGATVLKVESPLGDETRTWKPPEVDGQSTYYLSVNRNKQSIVLDFNDPTDLRLAQRLAERADVFIENFKPGGLRRFGLDYPSVAAANPSVIFASITGFGTAGGVDLPGYDLLVQALSGLMSLTGSPETEGFRSGIALFDVITGLHTSIGILAALHHRDLTGEGQHVELNLMSSALSGMVNQTGGYVLSGKVPGRLGNDHPSIFPYAPFTTADGQLMLAIGNDAQFRTLCAVLGLDGVLEDPRFATNLQRSINRDALRPLLVERLADKSADEWFTCLTAAKLPCAPILDVGAGIAFAEQIGLDPLVTVDSGGRSFPGVRNPITLSHTPVDYVCGPPGLGQDGTAIRRWLEADGAVDSSPSAAANRVKEASR